MGVAYVTVEALLIVVQGLLLLPATLWRTWNCLQPGHSRERRAEGDVG